MTTTTANPFEAAVRSVVDAVVRRQAARPEDFQPSQVSSSVTTLTKDEARAYLEIRESFERETEERARLKIR